jgi:hypothetical protein
MKLNETPALPMAPESAYDRALQRTLTDILRPLLRKINALDTSGGGYVAPALLNGWANFGGGYNPAGYLLDGLGLVHLRGLIKSGAMQQTAFTLPAGVRPANSEFIATVSANAFGSVVILSDGSVKPWDGVNTWFSLDGITFKAAQ